MRSVGWPELVVLLALFAIVAVFLAVLPMWKVLSKAGFPGALSLLGCIPGGVIVLLFVLAFVEWPALRDRRVPTVSSQ